MAAFKDEIGADLVRRLAAELTAAWPAFPRQRFQRGITRAQAARAPCPWTHVIDVQVDGRVLGSVSFDVTGTVPLGTGVT